MKNLVLTILLALPLLVFAQTKKEEPKYDMKTYYLVFLKKGPNRTQDSASAAQIQAGHIAYLEKMHGEGKLDMAGPMMENGDLRGICVYNVAKKEEVEQLVNLDPAIKAGRLVAEIHSWYAAKGSVLR